MLLLWECGPWHTKSSWCESDFAQSNMMPNATSEADTTFV
jgi:hypothetical protein